MLRSSISSTPTRKDSLVPVERDAYEAYFKLQDIEYAAENGNRASARHFNVNESMVRKWRKQESELRQVRKTKLSFRRNKSRWPELEVEQLVVEQRTTGRGVSTVTIRQKAKAIAEETLSTSKEERAAIFRTYCRDKITAPSHITNMDEIYPSWERWMTKGKHSFMKTMRQRRASYATICSRPSAGGSPYMSLVLLKVSSS
ncbi:hypothetical protein D4764_10G0008430 [Takifugu flavidus]|uniref:Brinker DNA-binding domain-containing protein n=1 Tax=Takifugu flavidus TaxID=433684 RepID=A0A5C6PKF6_9TELE|nr:hypothetical protein D4764_10G0008430 [Takifugu flavidus]